MGNHSASMQPENTSTQKHQTGHVMRHLKFTKKQLVDFYRGLIDFSPQAILAFNRTGHILLINKQMEQLFGYTEAEILGKNPDILVPKRYKNRYLEKLKPFLKRSALNKPPVQMQLFALCKDGREFPASIVINVISTGKDVLLLCLIHDSTREKKASKKINKLTNYDALTNLPNRIRFNKILLKRIQIATKKEQHFALLLINMNRFKFINDYYGHNIGDIVLKKAGARIAQQVRSNDFLARLGADEFVLLVDTESPHSPGILAKRLLAEFEAPIQVLDNIINISVSIGITLYPKGGKDEISLLKNADIALARAKTLKTCQFAYFSSELNKKYASRLFIEHNLALAIRQEEFHLVFQPQINLATGHIDGIETLLRWDNPETGQISPDIFIPIAESEGLIGTLGLWVFEQVCKQIQAWKKTGIQIRQIALNLSVNQLADQNLVASFCELCKKYQVSPAQIDLEITETSIMSLEADSLAILHQLNHAGFTLSIDDFGAGYSSLSRLSKIPVNTLKIDKSLIQDKGPHAGKILTAIIKLALNMDLNVIAEGVDSREKCNFLLQAGCTMAQGFYFYRPLDTETISHLLLQQQKEIRA